MSASIPRCLPVVLLIFISVATTLALPGAEYVFTLRSLGIGNIYVEGLRSRSVASSFSVPRNTYHVDITIYYSGDLLIVVHIGGSSLIVSGGHASSRLFLDPNTTLRIEVTNYGLDIGIIYGNSTIVLVGNNEENNHRESLLKLLFILSIIVPPVLLAVLRSRPLEEAELSKTEEFVVIL